jgi:hypothetical protein
MRMVEHNHPNHFFSCEVMDLHRVSRRHERLLEDNQVAISNLINRVHLKMKLIT